MSDEVRIPTSERLAQILELAQAPQRMIDRARQGVYDDFKSELDMPLRELVRDAQAAGLHDIANRAKAGEFDAQQWEAKAWAMSPEGQTTFREFLKPRKKK